MARWSNGGGGLGKDRRRLCQHGLEGEQHAEQTGQDAARRVAGLVDGGARVFVFIILSYVHCCLESSTCAIGKNSNRERKQICIFSMLESYGIGNAEFGKGNQCVVEVYHGILILSLLHSIGSVFSGKRNQFNHSTLGG